MSERIGSAEWINPEAVAEGFAYQKGAFWLGRTIDKESKAIGTIDDRHVLLVAGTRGGKGTTILVNNLCLWPGSAIVIDPKGENATLTAASRADGGDFSNGMGQSVHVLDPYHIAHVPDHLRATFNPLDWLDANDPYVTKKAERLATSLVPFKDKSDDYWDNEARSLLGALFLHVATSPLFEGKRTLMTVRDLVMRGDMITYEEFEKEAEYTETPLELLWYGMKANEVADGWVRDQGIYYSELLKASAKQWTGVRGAVKTATDFINGQGMRESLAQSTFSFEELKNSEQGATVYLSLPQDFIKSDRGWLRMMVDIVAMQAKLTTGQPRCGYPTLMMLDEFAGLERMDVLEQSIAQLAGYGVKMVFVVQNLSQLKEVYKEGWETFVSGAGVKIFFAIEDNLTREYISKQAGETEIIREGQSTNESEGKNESETKGTSSTEGRSANKSKTANTGRGRNSGFNIGLNRGGNSGTNYDADGGLLNLFPSKTGTNRSGGGGISGSYNRSGNKSTGKSNTTGTGTSFSETKTDSTTTGTTFTEGWGRSESFHKRYLIEPHDVGFKFARVDKRNDPRYPGVILVMISGERPMPIRKCNYFEDPLFHRRFEPHPDHDFHPLTSGELERPYARCHSMQVPERLLEVRLPSPGQLFFAFGQIGHTPYEITRSEGEGVTSGDTLVQWKDCEELFYPDNIGRPPVIVASSKGVVYETRVPVNGDGYIPNEPLLRIEPEEPNKNYIEQTSTEEWRSYFINVKGDFSNEVLVPWMKSIATLVGGVLLVRLIAAFGGWVFIPTVLIVWLRAFQSIVLIEHARNEQGDLTAERIAYELRTTTKEQVIHASVGLAAAIAAIFFGWWAGGMVLFCLIVWHNIREFFQTTGLMFRFFPFLFGRYRRSSPALIEWVENDSDQPSVIETARIKRIEKERETYRYDYDAKKFYPVT